jgi:ribosome-associated protein
MDIRKLQRAIVDGLEDVKAHNIVVFNTEHLSPLFERVIIASGTSNRQTKALASSVRETVKARGLNVLRTEGEENGEWIIVDCGAAVVHLMQPAIRDYYHLEELWGEKSVKMKLDNQATKLVKASAPAQAGASTSRLAATSGGARSGATSTESKPAPRKAGPKSAAAKGAGARGFTAGKAGAARASNAHPAPASKTAAGKSAARKTAAGKTAARKPASPKPASRKTIVRKVVAKKAGPRA